MKPVCYFSYSWDDADEIFMQQLKIEIERLSKYEVDVLYDKNKLQLGDEISEFEEKIGGVDLIVLFLTPSFKRKVLEKDCRYGAYREYKKILERKANGFEYVIPILVSSGAQDSILTEFENIIYEDINKVSNRYSTIAKTKQISFSKEFNALIQKIARTIIKKTKAAAWLQEHHYTSFEEEYNKMFLNTSATMIDTTFPSSCVVKMEAYDLVLHEQTDLVIGRKGSGKTTFLNMIYTYNPSFFQNNYKNPAPISAETFNLEYAYKALVKDIKEDFEILPTEKVLDVFWEVLFVLQCVYNVYVDMRDYKIEQDDDRLPNFKKIIKIFEDKFGSAKGALSSNNNIFLLAVELVSNYLQSMCFNNANADTLITSVVNNFSTVKIFENLFRKSEFSLFCQNIYRCKHKIFISIDGYDTQSADFRRRTRELMSSSLQEAGYRTEFEVLLYRELLYTIYNLKNQNISTFSYINKLFSKVHFCVIMPQDRYDEIRLYDRDIEKRKKCCLSWDAYDLLEMLVKRLEYCYEMEYQEENLQIRFDNILNKKLPNIPKTITIEIDGRDYEMSLFNYMLRLSFWRPRDLIKNFARIMKLGKENLVLEKTCIQEVIKDLLTNSARDIIQNEFLNEYNNTFEDLAMILNKFEGLNLIMEAKDFYEKLSKVPFILSTGEIVNTDEKIILLYKLGVIGLYYNNKSQEDKKLIRAHGFGYHICFVFNEGLQPIENFLTSDIMSVREKFIFNPIFAKYLMLNYNTDEIIGNFNFDYIKTNHLMKDSIRRM